MEKLMLDIDKIWDEYHEDRSDDLKHVLFAHYLDYADNVASRFIRNHKCWSMEMDIFQFSKLGLLDAITKFNDSKGATFKTYSSRRIFGSIIDGLRKYGHYNTRRKYNLIFESFDVLTNDNDEFLDITHASDSEGITTCQDKEFVETLINIPELYPRDIFILKYYFVDNLTFQEIGEKIGLAQSRISQLMKKILPIVKSHYERLGIKNQI